MIRMSHSFVSAMSVIGSGVSKNEAPDVFSVDAADLYSLAFGAHPVMPAAAATAAADAPTPKNARRLIEFFIMIPPCAVFLFQTCPERSRLLKNA